MDRILLTGATGQLGRAILETGAERIVPAGRSAPPGGVALDLERPETFARAIKEARPDWVVHAAAMTNVDGCERDPIAAWRVNAEATGALARAARDAGARMLYVSTDYVFDGERGRYAETDHPHPIQEYGRSKLGGETLGVEVLPDLLIARTSVVYGPHKSNFVVWLINELRAGRRVRIVDDQIVTSTLTFDLAEQIFALVDADATGVFHTAGATEVSRHAMATEIAEVFGLDASLIDRTSSDQLTWIARRPLRSSLDTRKVSKYKPPLSLRAALVRLKAELEKRS